MQTTWQQCDTWSKHSLNFLRKREKNRCFVPVNDIKFAIDFNIFFVWRSAIKHYILWCAHWQTQWTKGIKLENGISVHPHWNEILYSFQTWFEKNSNGMNFLFLNKRKDKNPNYYCYFVGIVTLFPNCTGWSPNIGNKTAFKCQFIFMYAKNRFCQENRMSIKEGTRLKVKFVALIEGWHSLHINIYHRWSISCVKMLRHSHTVQPMQVIRIRRFTFCCSTSIAFGFLLPAIRFQIRLVVMMNTTLIQWHSNNNSKYPGWSYSSTIYFIGCATLLFYSCSDLALLS